MLRAGMAEFCKSGLISEKVWAANVCLANDASNDTGLVISTSAQLFQTERHPTLSNRN